MSRPRSEPVAILVRLAEDAQKLGADELEIEYKDGRDEVFAFKGDRGLGIANFESSSEEAGALRRELCAVGQRSRVVTLSGVSYRLTVTRFDSFGEVAFRVEIKESH